MSSMQIIDFLIGTESERFINKRKKIIDKIISLEDEYSNLTDEDLRNKKQFFQQRFNNGETLDDLLPEAFAVVKEATYRVLGMKHFPVQLVGGIVINEGNIAEMRTGEGKTLVATLPAYLNALQNNVHIVTTNDYLARRDSVWMGQIYSFLGLSVGVINSQNMSYIYDKGHKEVDAKRDEIGSFKVFYEFLKPTDRVSAYRCSVIYGTNSEFGFDYLRDSMELEKKDVRQNNHSFAIIDEIDSILIDEAKTPLIISSVLNVPSSYYRDFAKLATTFIEGTDYDVDAKARSISITSSGIEKAERALKVENLYIEKGRVAIHYLENALRARAIFKKDKNYIVKDDAVIMVDEFSGRMQPGRSWSNGLHQSIEAKENVSISNESVTFATITYQNFFKMYKKLSGMTGTAYSSKEEFRKVYNIGVIQIPTNKEVQRIDEVDLIYQSQEGKFKAIVNKIKELNKIGQPVLVGTSSIEQNEFLAKRLTKQKIKHNVLNAKNHEKEGEIIAQAGKRHAVTIATNLAGRGIDIQLGGLPHTKEEYEEVKKLGGLFVLGTERHESRRVDNQLRGRSGRQGDEGETQFFISLDDGLVKIFGSDRLLAFTKKFGLPEDQAIQTKFVSNAIESAQKRIEGYNFDSRKNALRYDTAINKQRDKVYKIRSEILNADVFDVSVIDKYNLDKEIVEKIKEMFDDVYLDEIKKLFLQSITYVWAQHLSAIEYAASSTSLRSIGQKDPLIEYKNEINIIFNSFWENVSSEFKNQGTIFLEKETNRV